MTRVVWIDIPVDEVDKWSGEVVTEYREFEISIAAAKTLLAHLQEHIPRIEEAIRMDKIQRIAELEAELKQLKEEL